MDTIQYIVVVLGTVLLVYFSFSNAYFLFFSIASKFYKEKVPQGNRVFHRNISILVPAYKEDNVIVDTAFSALNHKSLYHTLKVFVIADSLKDETLMKLKNTGAGTIRVNFAQSTKAKAINEALKLEEVKADAILILDADNIMADGFVDRIMLRYNGKNAVVQGHRTAKNQNSGFALMDGVSEEVNNGIFRKGHATVGLSSALIGSGFVCEYHLFKNLMGQIAAVGGFDKELEILLLKNRHRIAYANTAMVYDEKTSEKNVFVNQRRRWLSAQFVYLRRYFLSGFSEFFRHKNADYLDKVVQMALPPRIINLGLVTFFSLLSWGFFLLREQAPITVAVFWTANLIALMVSFTLTVPGRYFWSNPVKIILALPSGFFSMFKALFKTRKANKNFIHTPHGAH